MRLEGRPMAAAETLARVRGACRDLAGAFYRDLSHLGVGGALCQWLSSWRTKFARALYARLGRGVFARGGLRGSDPSLGLAVPGAHVAVAMGVRRVPLSR